MKMMKKTSYSMGMMGSGSGAGALAGGGKSQDRSTGMKMSSGSGSGSSSQDRVYCPGFRDSQPAGQLPPTPSTPIRLKAQMAGMKL